MSPYSPFLRPRPSGPVLVVVLLVMAVHFAGALSARAHNGPPASPPPIETVNQAAVYGKALQCPTTEITSASCQPSA